MHLINQSKFHQSITLNTQSLCYIQKNKIYPSTCDGSADNVDTSYKLWNDMSLLSTTYRENILWAIFALLYIECQKRDNHNHPLWRFNNIIAFFKVGIISREVYWRHLSVINAKIMTAIIWKDIIITLFNINIKQTTV